MLEGMVIFYILCVYISTVRTSCLKIVTVYHKVWVYVYIVINYKIDIELVSRSYKIWSCKGRVIQNPVLSFLGVIKVQPHKVQSHDVRVKQSMVM